jgi:hypothetical protein
LPDSADIDAYDIVWGAFARRGNPNEFLIYEELSSYLGKKCL